MTQVSGKKWRLEDLRLAANLRNKCMLTTLMACKKFPMKGAMYSWKFEISNALNKIRFLCTLYANRFIYGKNSS